MPNIGTNKLTTIPQNNLQDCAIPKILNHDVSRRHPPTATELYPTANTKFTRSALVPQVHMTANNVHLSDVGAQMPVGYFGQFIITRPHVVNAAMLPTGRTERTSVHMPPMIGIYDISTSTGNFIRRPTSTLTLQTQTIPNEDRITHAETKKNMLAHATNSVLVTAATSQTSKDASRENNRNSSTYIRPQISRGQGSSNTSDNIRTRRKIPANAIQEIHNLNGIHDTQSIRTPAYSPNTCANSVISESSYSVPRRHSSGCSTPPNQLPTKHNTRQVWNANKDENNTFVMTTTSTILPSEQRMQCEVLIPEDRRSVAATSHATIAMCDDAIVTDNTYSLPPSGFHRSETYTLPTMPRTLGRANNTGTSGARNGISEDDAICTDSIVSPFGFESSELYTSISLSRNHVNTSKLGKYYTPEGPYAALAPTTSPTNLGKPFAGKTAIRLKNTLETDNARRISMRGAGRSRPSAITKSFRNRRATMSLPKNLAGLRALVTNKNYGSVRIPLLTRKTPNVIPQTPVLGDKTVPIANSALENFTCLGNTASDNVIKFFVNSFLALTENKAISTVVNRDSPDGISPATGQEAAATTSIPTNGDVSNPSSNETERIDNIPKQATNYDSDKSYEAFGNSAVQMNRGNKDLNRRRPRPHNCLGVNYEDKSRQPPDNGESVNMIGIAEIPKDATAILFYKTDRTFPKKSRIIGSKYLFTRPTGMLVNGVPHSEYRTCRFTGRKESPAICRQCTKNNYSGSQETSGHTNFANMQKNARYVESQLGGRCVGSGSAKIPPWNCRTLTNEAVMGNARPTHTTATSRRGVLGLAGVERLESSVRRNPYASFEQKRITGSCGTPRNLIPPEVLAPNRPQLCTECSKYLGVCPSSIESKAPETQITVATSTEDLNADKPKKICKRRRKSEVRKSIRKSKMSISESKKRVSIKEKSGSAKTTGKKSMLRDKSSISNKE